jgi:F-type H+-transporting ATPase subunit gamma
MASENAARLRAMQAAEKNILELAQDLDREFSETRQGLITAELLDIVAGFEALGEPGG